MNDTQFVMKNHKVVQPEVAMDDLQLYYDVKGKKDTDVHKDKLLDMSGGNKHATLTNFAFSKGSGYTGGLVFDGVDDILTRPVLTGLSPTSMTYQMNSNILSYETGNTVKRVKDGNVISRKGVNMLRNGNFFNRAAGWWSGSSTQKFVITDRIGSFIGSGHPSSVIGNWLKMPDTITPTILGNEYLISLELKIEDITKEVYIGHSYFDIKTITATGEFVTYYTKIKVTRIDTTPSFNIAGSTGAKIYFKNVQVIDLTTAFGAGKEPTIENIQANPDVWGWTPNPNDLIDTTAIKGNIMGDVEGIIDDLNKTPILSGNPIYTDKADDAVVHVEVDGKSEQNAGSGKNLFNVKTYVDLEKDLFQAGTYALTADNKLIVNRTDSRALSKGLYRYFVKLEKNTNYTFSADTIMQWRVFLFSEDSNEGVPKQATAKSIVFNSGENTLLALKVYPQSLAYPVIVGDLQLEKGIIATPYEPPAPPPANPIPITSVGKDYSMTNSVTPQEGKYILEASGLIGSSGSHTLFEYMEAKPNTAYIFHGKEGYETFQARYYFYDKDKKPLEGKLFGANSGQNARYTSPTNTAYVSLSAQIVGGGTPVENWILREEAYTVGFDIVSSVGKENLFLNSNQILKMAGSTAIFIQTAQIKELRNNVGGVATISFDIKVGTDGTSRNVLVYRYQGSGLSISFGTKTITPTAETQRFSFTGNIVDNVVPSGYNTGSIIIYDSAKNQLEVTNIKIELGEKTLTSQAPEDIPYDTQTPTLYKTNILLSEPLRSVGDVKDRLFLDTDGLWKVERNVGEVIFDGTEAMSKYSSVSTTTSAFLFSSGNIPKLVNFNNKGIIKGTHMSFSSGKYNSEGFIGLTSWSGQGSDLFVLVPNEIANTLDSFKIWLKSQKDSGNSFVVQYELLTLTIETLPQSEQVKLNNIQSFKGSNYVYTVDKIGILPVLHGAFKPADWYKENLLINSLKIYNRGLTNEEMLKNYNTEKKRWGV